ncbi:hypothetical protein Tco_0990410 [Tanacetum coccineum]|uniref:Uncharacterized protein n=1 Tax=Tanacetum coccineum TaxID=301880 RepID=A0ABQ5EWG9_9ASTR
MEYLHEKFRHHHHHHHRVDEMTCLDDEKMKKNRMTGLTTIIRVVDTTHNTTCEHEQAEDGPDVLLVRTHPHNEVLPIASCWGLILTSQSRQHDKSESIDLNDGLLWKFRRVQDVASSSHSHRHACIVLCKGKTQRFPILSAYKLRPLQFRQPSYPSLKVTVMAYVLDDEHNLKMKT